MNHFKQIDCFSINLRFYKFLGIYPLDMPAFFYPYYSKIFVSFFIVAYVFVCTINLFFLPRHIDDFIEELILYFTELSCMCKVLTILFNASKIKTILYTLENETFQPDTTKTSKIVDTAKAFYLRYWKIVFCFSATSNLVHVLSPFVIHIILKVKLELPVSTFSFIPDHMKQANIYALYAYQSIGMHFIMLYTVNIDTFFVGLMILLISQLEILAEKLKAITEVFQLEQKDTQKRNPNENNEDDLILQLNKAIKHYDKVIQYCSLVEEVFSISLFVEFGVASCIICICLFRFTIPATWQYYIFLTTYITVMISLIMVPCWFGTRIMDKSCLLSKAIYSCDWTPRSKRFKSSLRLLVERANRPLSITGLKMFPLSLPTFTSIMNSAYSFFTLLRHMQSR